MSRYEIVGMWIGWVLGMLIALGLIGLLYRWTS